MSGYLSFEMTGVKPVDDLLNAIERAGDAYHNTEQWIDREEDGVSKCDLIQARAQDCYHAITRLTAEVERLRDMVRRAYNDGFGEGIKEHTTHKGGNPWNMSKWPAALKEPRT